VLYKKLSTQGKKYNNNENLTPFQRSSSSSLPQMTKDASSSYYTVRDSDGSFVGNLYLSRSLWLDIPPHVSFNISSLMGSEVAKGIQSGSDSAQVFDSQELPRSCV